MSIQNYCGNCGKKFESLEKFCGTCGAPNSAKQFRDDYYDILQVSRNASQEVIQAAYQGLAQKTDGDSEKMNLLQEAYEVLGDADKRTEYDGWVGTRGQPTVVQNNYTNSNRLHNPQPSDADSKAKKVFQWGITATLKFIGGVIGLIILILAIYAIYFITKHLFHIGIIYL